LLFKQIDQLAKNDRDRFVDHDLGAGYGRHEGPRDVKGGLP
jgi:hypothetical protein